MSGNNQGTSGIVTKIEDGKVRILREDNKAELLVMLSNLALKTADYSRQQLKTEKTSGHIKKFDMIAGSDDKIVGVVIMIDAHFLTIIDLSGTVRKINKLQVKSILRKDFSVKNKYNQNIQKKFTV